MTKKLISPKSVTLIKLDSFDNVLPKDIVRLLTFNDLLKAIKVYNFKDVWKVKDTYYLLASEVIYIFENNK